MQISGIHVENYKALSSVQMDFEDLTAIIGENNSGKSAFLKAIDLFFSGSPKVSPKDFNSDDRSRPIEISIEFSNLTPSEMDRFSGNLVDGRLIVTRTLNASNTGDHGQFSVDAFVNPEFSACRNESGKSAKRTLYKELQKSFELPSEKNADEISGYLEAWEARNPEKLSRQRVGGFRGFQNVAVGQLREKTEFILVPAVSDVADEVGESRKSPIRDLLNAITRQTIENNPEFQTFVAEANEKLEALTAPEQFPALADIGKSLSDILKNYYKDSSLVATWDPITQIPIQFPSAKIDVRDHNFTSGVDGVGHGLQRAIILTILEFVAKRRASEGESHQEFSVAQSDIILGIEEPEIYQHPTKQRLFQDVLKRLTETFSTVTGIRIQIIYATHSPLMVELPRCHEVRVVRRIIEDGARRNTQVRKLTLTECSNDFAVFLGKPPMSDSSFAAKLHTFTPEIAEGFFARCVVLVEGVSDRSVVNAFMQTLGRSCLAEGIVIASVDGKTKLDKPAAIFSRLGVPTFVLFDNDQTQKKSKNSVHTNRLLQWASGVSSEKIVDWPNGVADRYAAWDGDLESYIKSIVGDEIYTTVRDEMAVNYDLSGDECVKSPAVASGMLLRFIERGFQFPHLEAIAKRIDFLIESGA